MKKTTLNTFHLRRLRIAFMLLATFCFHFGGFASSHREAPLISNDPLADNTDVYAFRSPDDPNTITLIANYIPAQLPHGGPNYYTFGENIRYEIHVDNNINTTGDDIIYRFTFTQTHEDPTTFFNIRLGKQNQKTTYLLEKSTDGGQSFAAVITNGIVPPNNIGPRSIESSVGLGTTYEQLMRDAIMTASSGEKVFAGPADDPFFVDLGGIFDLGDAPRQNNNNIVRDGLAQYNVHTIAIQVPIASLQKDGKDASMTANILDPDFVIGVWASASRRAVKTLGMNGEAPEESGEWIQVSRLGMPLTNEAVIPIGEKDEWNSRTPYNENPDHFEYFYNPELALYMDDDLFGGAVPAFAALRIQRNSLQQFDFGNQQDGLFTLKGNAALDGTALDDAVFGTLLLPGAGKPRSVDLWPAFHTGVPNLAPYQLATGKAGNPLAEGKPFIHNFLPNGGDMLRLNMATPPTPRDDASFSSLGLIQAAVLGLTDPAYTTTDLQWIPNMDGFPNGRRLEDDVTRIELQAVSGVVLAAIGLWYDDFDASDPNASPVTQDLLDVLGYTTGVEANDAPFMPSFPYLAAPWSGKGVGTGQQITFEQPDVLPPTQFADRILSFTLVNAETDEDIGTHNDGGIINLALYPSINIRANTQPQAVGSVVFDLNGKRFRTENVAPYALGGDSPPGDYAALNLSPGDYTFTATPYTEARGKGKAGISRTITFTIVNSPVVSGFTLVNADTDQDIMDLKDGDVIHLKEVGTANLNVRANTSPQEVGSVVFDLNGKRFRTESVFPYALAGDAPPGDYFDWVVTPGMYTVTATPFTEKGGKGKTGFSRTITFEVVDDDNTTAKKGNATGKNAKVSESTSTNIATPFATDQFSIRIYPNPVEDHFSFNFSGEENENVSVFIYNLNGKLLGSQSRQLNGLTEVEVGVQDFQLEPGIYLVKVVPEHASPAVFRIVKK